MPIRTSRIPFVFATLAALILGGQAIAQGSNTGLSLELNNATDVEGACRLTFVVTNANEISLTGLSYEVVLYDTDGIVPDDGFLLFEFGGLADGKTKVVQFILEERSCADISRILVNDVSECRSDSGEQTFCLDGLSVASRNDIGIGL